MEDDFPEEDESILENNFKLATDFVAQNASVMESNDLLYLYGRYKQAVCGTCTEPMPGILKFKSRSKWSAWHDLGNMTKDEAMKQYIDKVEVISPGWNPEGAKKVNKKSHFGPVNSTCQNTDPELKEESKTAFDFVKEGNVNRLKQLLKTDSKVKDLCDEGGLSLLHWACDRGHCEIAELLILSGIDINCQDKDGQTPLHYASSCGHEKVITFLLKTGAVTNVYDVDGLCPADVAYSTSIKELLTANAV